MQINKIGNKKELLILAGVASGIIFIFIPLIINETYKVNRGYVTIWDASDVLIFYGSLLTFFGTVALGISSIVQSNRANEINSRLSQLEQERFKNDLQPFVIVSDWKLEATRLLEIIQAPQKLYIQVGIIKLEHNEVSLCLSLFFTNTSNSFATVYYSNAKVYKKDTYIQDWYNSTSNQPNPNLYLKSGETGEIVFYCTEEEMVTFRGTNIKFGLILSNRFSENYKETLDIIIPHLGKTHDAWYVTLNPQNYLIQKCNEF
ncbi:hypothetical protein [Desulfosporosinus sp. OT]|uniref:hypothetical protein n=1 Tax=Desulfosporosinus sp. OT TaxID=913865 RepID=UPI000223A911|nr:hypothetical protein [Desulfosporosinus sp. OT]EGW39075.1 hypothetical protein DOT_3026 [Desulfosporosinus sp. OT]